jgi:hypothetical protein
VPPLVDQHRVEQRPHPLVAEACEVIAVAVELATAPLLAPVHEGEEPDLTSRSNRSSASGRRKPSGGAPTFPSSSAERSENSLA